ncbi:ABC transporter substrate-binding protein [Rubrimonas cliftonensis]|uniref:Amino acid/amide ABC transporter substrate-binding protein, HAAT family n=1 Tax=Rubrimonas cliftonensis TaxID=89524 RepID=A0A1H4BB32_9RHOB|nr:ABC transporter substrate-binding protein [Rubrimonas cliftonensis]SEA45317.1 amino acid/amide ABC transporter substrate-binding protein, HAAT family [Rubrimonas cliftonensis]
MKRHLAGALGALVALGAGGADAQAVKFGLLGGVSGPIAALAPAIIDASRLAFDEVNAQGGLLDGRQIEAVVGDAGCNPQSGGDAASKLVNVEGAAAIVGAHCSGATLAAANTATIPAGRILISPASTSPAVTALEDGDTVFRTVPSDDYQGAALARALKAQGYGPVAVTYLNNDYGKGLAEAFRAEYAAQGGEVAVFAAHEEGKASYRAELAELSRSGADTLAIFDYGDGSGLTILRQALENGFFERFVGGDGMKAENIIGELGAENLTSFVASSPTGEGGEALERFNAATVAAGGDPNAIFATSGYDAGMLVALAFEHAGGDLAKMGASLRAVAGAPGEPILPGEWAKAKGLIAAGTDIDYKGAAGDMEFDANGDVPGAYALFKVEGDGFAVISAIE